MTPRKETRPRKQGYLFVGYTDQLSEGRPVTVRLMGKPVSVFKQEGGFVAREMSCKHQGADLSRFPVRDRVVTCERHGWQYDIDSGECLNQDSPPLRSHHVTVEENAVFVAIMPGPPPSTE